MSHVHTVPAYAEGDIVRVRSEPVLSVIAQPTDGPPTCDPALLPELTVCCVPVALVRPADDPDGHARWVEISDLTLISRREEP